MITRVDVVGANSDNISFTNPPTEGDLIIVGAFSDNLIPVIPPAGFSVIVESEIEPLGNIACFKIADGTETSTGTWTNATSIQAAIYHGAKTQPGDRALFTGTSTLNVYSIPALQLDETSGSSWVLAFVAARKGSGTWSSLAGTLSLANSNLISSTYDSNGGLTSFVGGDSPTSNSQGRYTTIAIEIMAHKAHGGHSKGGHWTVWECGTFYEIEETGAKFPCGSDTLATILNDAKNAGITVTIKKA